MAITIIPDTLLFRKFVDVPPLLKGADKADFVRTCIENSAPLGADKIRVGWTDFGGQTVAYAGVAERIFADFSEAKAAQNGGAYAASSVLSCGGIKRGIGILKTEKCISAVQFESGRATAVFAEAFDSPESLKTAYRTIMCRLDTAKTMRCFVLVAARRTFAGDAAFTLEEQTPQQFAENAETTGKNRIVWRCAKSRLKNANLCSASAVAAAKNMQRASLLKKAASFAFAGAFATLAVWNIALVADLKRIGKLEGELPALEARAGQIEARNAEALKLGAFAKPKIHPIETLAYAASACGRDISFARVRQESPIEAEITGTAPNVEAVENFAKQLRALPQTNAVDVKNQSNRGETRWTMTLSLKKALP